MRADFQAERHIVRTSVVMHDKPKACPWCGKRGRVRFKWKSKERSIMFHVGCENALCPIRPSTPYVFASEEDAVAAWNRRTNGI